MNVEHDLKLHSHYLEQLFESDKTTRERIHDMKQQIGIQAHILSQHDRELLQLVENSKIRTDQITKLKAEMEKSHSTFEFVKSLFEKPINWLYITILLFLIESVKGMPVVEVAKNIALKIF